MAVWGHIGGFLGPDLSQLIIQGDLSSPDVLVYTSTTNVAIYSTAPRHVRGEIRGIWHIPLGAWLGYVAISGCGTLATGLRLVDYRAQGLW